MAPAFYLWQAGRLLTFGVVEDAPLPAGTAPQPGIRHDGQLHCRLSGLMETGRVFLDPGPTFIAFVERMAASPSILPRWLRRRSRHSSPSGCICEREACSCRSRYTIPAIRSRYSPAGALPDDHAGCSP